MITPPDQRQTDARDCRAYVRRAQVAMDTARAYSPLPRTGKMILHIDAKLAELLEALDELADSDN